MRELVNTMYLENSLFIFYATTLKGKGAPALEFSLHEHGTGCRVILGPLLVEFDLLRSCKNESNQDAAEVNSRDDPVPG